VQTHLEVRGSEGSATEHWCHMLRCLQQPSEPSPQQSLVCFKRGEPGPYLRDLLIGFSLHHGCLI